MNTAANRIAALGYTPIRVYPTSKKPDGPSFESCSASDPAEALRLFDRRSCKWLGIWLSPSVVALDFDVHDVKGFDRGEKHDIATERRAVFYEMLGETVPVGTPSDISGSGGIRDYYRLPPGGSVKNQTGIVPNVDVKAGGSNPDGTRKKSLVVVDPSGPVVGGGFYKWTAPLIRAEELPELPGKIYRFLSAPKKRREGIANLYGRVFHWLRVLPDTAEGERRNTFRDCVFEIAGRCAAVDLDINDLKDRLCAKIGETYLDTDEIETTFIDGARDGASKPIRANGEPSKKTLTQQLIELGMTNTRLFPCETRRFLFDEMRGITIDLSATGEVTEWLGGRWIRVNPTTPFPTNQAKDAIENLRLHASCESEAPVFRRFGFHEGRVLYNTGVSAGGVVVVSAEGRATKTPGELAAMGVFFQRPDGVAELSTYLDFDTSVEIIEGLFPNLGRDGAVMMSAWAVAALHPKIKVPILSLSGPQGSGKSVLAAFLKCALDPCGDGSTDAQLRSLLKDERSLVNMLGTSGILCFDNVSLLPMSVQDLLCQAVTGGEVESRRLYTDGDMRRVSLNSRMVVTSIVQPISQEDLLNRAIILDVASIPKEDRFDEAALEQKVKRQAGALREALLTATPAALGSNDVDVPHVHRLRGWLRYAAGGAGELGFTQQELVDAVRKNQTRAVDDQLSDNPLARVVMALPKPWSGDATTLWHRLDPEDRRQSFRTARGVSSGLKRLEPNLADKGISVERVRTAETRTIIISGTYYASDPLIGNSESF